MKKNHRRNFLKNLSLSSLAIGFLPSFLVPKKLKANGACNETTDDAYGQGPFYTSNAPTLTNGQLASLSEIGTRIIISGRVLNLDCSQAIPNTEIDIWHANDAGSYDNNGYNLRGKVISNNQGYYIFETIRPGLYLNGSTYRPSHIHFKITPPGFNPLITQLYFQGDPYISNDFAASMNSGQYDASSRIIPLNTGVNGVLEGVWDIVIDGNGVSTKINELHLDKGIIYKTTPNPFSDEIKIKFGVFKKAKIKLEVIDLKGKNVAIIEEKNLIPDKYEVIWKGGKKIKSGHYFIIMKANDLQIHYKKVVKK